MAISHVSKIYAVEDAKIAALTADPAGGSPTYGSLIDVPGIKTVEISGSVDTKQLRGDNTLLDSNSTLTDITVAVTHAKISLDVLPVILGGTTTDAGSGSTETVTFERLGTNAFSYFKLEAKTPTNGADPTGGDIHFVLHKLMISSFPDMGHAEEDYRIVSFSAVATPLVSNSKWISVVINETAAAIA